MAAPMWSPSDAESIAKALGGRRSGRGWMARCLAHNDGTPSLIVGQGANGRPLFFCFAGCSWPAILEAIGRW